MIRSIHNISKGNKSNWFLFLFFILFSFSYSFSQCPPAIDIIDDDTILCNQSIVLGSPVQTNNPPTSLASTCDGATTNLTQKGGVYTNSVVTTGGQTNINNSNSLVDVGNINPMGPNAWKAIWYSDFTSQAVEVCAGGSFNISIQGINLNANPPFQCQIWIDWNNDGSYSNTNEIVFTSQLFNASPISINNAAIAVPANQPNGVYRMRIRWKADAPFISTDKACTNGNPNGTYAPYGGYTSGSGYNWYSDEIEDYTVKVSCGNSGGGGSGGTLTYDWSPSATLDDNTIPDPTATPDSTTTYTVTVNDVDNNCSATASVKVTVAGLIDIDNITTSSCKYGKYKVTGSLHTSAPPSTGDLVVEDCHGNKKTIASAPFNGQTNYSFSFSNLDADGSNCSIKAYFTDASCPTTKKYTAPDAPTIIATGNAICGGGNATISATGTPGGGTYSWDNGAGNNATATVSPTSTTTYTVTYTKDGCMDTAKATVTVNSALTYDTTIVRPTCGDDNGEIHITGGTGTAPFTFTIDDGINPAQTNQKGDFTNLPFGSYTMKIKDNNGCSVSGTINLSEKNAPDITSIVPTNPSCYGECDGTAKVNITGGTTPYTFTWKDASNTVVGSNADNIQDLCDGHYSVVVEDDNGCKVQGTVTLKEPDSIDASFTLTDFCVGSPNVASNIATPGGIFSLVPPTIEGATINPQTGEITDAVGGKTYVVKYSVNSGGCSATSVEKVDVKAGLQPDFVGDTLSACKSLTVHFIETSNTTSGTSCVWNFGDGTIVDDCSGNISHTYSNVGVYTVSLTISDAMGCSGEEEKLNYILKSASYKFGC